MLQRERALLENDREDKKRLLKNRKEVIKHYGKETGGHRVSLY